MTESISPIPCVRIDVGTWFQILTWNFSDRSGLFIKICNVDDDKFLCHFRIKECKNKVRCTSTAIYYCYIVGKRELLHLLNHSWAKAIIGKQGVSAPHYYDFRIQHRGLHSLDELLSHYLAVPI